MKHGKIDMVLISGRYCLVHHKIEASELVCLYAYACKVAVAILS